VFVCLHESGSLTPPAVTAVCPNPRCHILDFGTRRLLLVCQSKAVAPVGGTSLRTHVCYSSSCDDEYDRDYFITPVCLFG
jgi:hypothetical protein